MNTTKTYKWAVVGAGVAGISSVAALMDHGVSCDDIVWLDPHFNAGDLAENWPHVSSNTTVADFLNALNESNAFAYAERDQEFKLDSLDKTTTCALEAVVEPLQWLTKCLMQKISCIKHTVDAINSGVAWNIVAGNSNVAADRIILTIGSEPKVLDVHTQSQTVTSLKDALSAEYWQQQPKDTKVAVFGSSHSAIIILRHALESGLEVKNFYRSPLKFSKRLDGWTLYDNTGLKGETLRWARDDMPNYSSKLTRVYSDNDNIETHLPDCTHVAYAVGFKPRTIPIDGHVLHDYDAYHGIIGNNIFGTGIAYPRLVTYPTGYQEHNVGFLKFVRDLKDLLPIWAT